MPILRLQTWDENQKRPSVGFFLLSSETEYEHMTAPDLFHNLLLFFLPGPGYLLFSQSALDSSCRIQSPIESVFFPDLDLTGTKTGT